MSPHERCDVHPRPIPLFAAWISRRRLAGKLGPDSAALQRETAGTGSGYHAVLLHCHPSEGAASLYLHSHGAVFTVLYNVDAMKPIVR